MEILTITLIILLLVLLIIIIDSAKKANEDNKRLTNIIDELQDIIEYQTREIDRSNNQIQYYEKAESDIKFVKIGSKEIKKNFIYKGKRVLVGDYIEESYNNTLNVLKSYGITVDLVHKGTDIVDKIKHGYKCDLIFTNNIYRHGYDGPTTLEELKQIKGFKIPVIIHTISFNKRNYFVNECGFDDYIEKPLDQKKIKKILEKYLKTPHKARKINKG